jgi:hypothetical protein
LIAAFSLIGSATQSRNQDYLKMRFCQVRCGSDISMPPVAVKSLSCHGSTLRIALVIAASPHQHHRQRTVSRRFAATHTQQEKIMFVLLRSNTSNFKEVDVIGPFETRGEARTEEMRDDLPYKGYTQIKEVSLPELRITLRPAKLHGDEPTANGERLIAAGRAADDDFGEDITDLTPEQMAAKLIR